jgi:ribokinase
VDAARNFDPLAVTSVAHDIASDDWVVLQGNLHPKVTRDCLALAKRRRAVAVLNPSPAYAANCYDWSLVDLVVLNRGEAIELGGRDDPVAAARRLIAAGAGAAVLTLGSGGAMLLSPTQELRVAAPEVTTVDTVGAGDVFCGVLIAARSGGVFVERRFARRRRGRCNLRQPRRRAGFVSDACRDEPTFDEQC